MSHAVNESPKRLRGRPSRRQLRAAETSRRIRAARSSAAQQRPSAPRRSRGRRLFAKLTTVAAMLGAVGLAVATSVPANAFFHADPFAQTASKTAASVQSLAQIEAVPVIAPTRDAYTVVSLQAQLKAKFASQDFSYTNDPNGTIQWPFPVAVPIASGFGERQVAGCGFCSTFHEGVDFIPGSGVAIQAIADGVVSLVQDDRGGLGNHVVIDHVINGQKVQSVYAHMIEGSVKVAVGQPVKVTDVVGQVGSTGAATGAHLHLEIHLDGVPVDPFAWLKTNAN